MSARIFVGAVLLVLFHVVGAQTVTEDCGRGCWLGAAEESASRDNRGTSIWTSSGHFSQDASRPGTGTRPLAHNDQHHLRVAAEQDTLSTTQLELTTTTTMMNSHPVPANQDAGRKSNGDGEMATMHGTVAFCGLPGQSCPSRPVDERASTRYPPPSKTTSSTPAKEQRKLPTSTGFETAGPGVSVRGWSLSKQKRGEFNGLLAARQAVAATSDAIQAAATTIMTAAGAVGFCGPAGMFCQYPAPATAAGLEADIKVVITATWTVPRSTSSSSGQPPAGFTTTSSTVQWTHSTMFTLPPPYGNGPSAPGDTSGTQSGTRELGKLAMVVAVLLATAMAIIFF
ncbi:uncharacterized protein LTR77_009917 [Saxophila tyrrhenica]|uniref:Uncharacterized protein n=1 Tax=Saxophila tyrrhenica TaxID=1690608 RepID=A0AAV9P0C9_9PEZI|nr:hypothetical protein LTR77_009917 [Saxophila tyrrhenica]